MIGNILLIFALLASIFSGVMYWLSFKGYENTLKPARYSFHAMSIAILIASAVLLQAIITHQYQYNYVYNYSGSGMSFGLLLSTFWAGQEGSFMLWVLLSSIVGLVLLDYTSKHDNLEPTVMLGFTISISFLLVMVNPLLKSPFNYIYSEPSFISTVKINATYLSQAFMQNFIFQDPNTNESFVKVGPELYAILSNAGISIGEFIVEGKGLNPLLQNFWMQIHPPMLFAGFSLSSVPFSFAFAALLRNDYKNWVKQSFPWTLISMGILGLAIMLGGYWAYGVLGWGGYWGWDPVENSSLVPWIVGVAFVHTLIVQRKTQTHNNVGRFAKTNLILAMLTYILVIYSTFLTRSGILGDSSVHSFVDPGMIVYFFLVLFILTFALGSIAMVIWRWKSLSQFEVKDENPLSRELALFTGSVVLLASALIILVGTSLPIFGTTVEIRFYNQMNLPIAIILGLLNGLSLVLKWKQTNLSEMLKSSFYSLILTTVFTLLIIFIGGVTAIMNIIFVISASFTLFINLEFMFKIIKARTSHIGSYVAHIGIALFMLGVVATGSFSQKVSADLVKNEPQEVLGSTLTFLGYTPIEKGQKFAFNININDDESNNIISPVMYVAKFNNSLMREPDILSKITNDYYITPLSFEEKANKDDSNSKDVTLHKGESVEYNSAQITFNDFTRSDGAMEAMQTGADFYFGADISVTKDGKTFEIMPKMQVVSGKNEFVFDVVDELDLKVNLLHLNASGSVNLNLTSITDDSKSEQVNAGVLSVEVSKEPFIGLIWVGTLIVFFGFLISTYRRTKEARN